MASNDEHHQNVAVEKPSKIERVEKSIKKVGKSSVVMPRVVRIYMTDNDATDSSSDEEEMLQREKSQRPKKLWIKEIMIENGRTRIISVLEYMKGNSNPARRCVRFAAMGLRMGRILTKEKKSAAEAKPKTLSSRRQSPLLRIALLPGRRLRLLLNAIIAKKVPAKTTPSKSLKSLVKKASTRRGRK
ncbi:hypothetical protein BC332_01696 [Capsicum chinense]|nr:hypothetical protein BC332_01696 [Capsicum chinense]